MQIVIQALWAISAIGAIIIGILLYYQKQTPVVWVTFATIVSFVLIVCLHWQNSIWNKQKEFKLLEPRFSESIEYFTFSLGERGITVGYKKDVLEKSHKINSFVFYDYRPVELYIEKGQLYADVKIYGGSGLPPIKIIKNKLSNKPDNWDFNSNKNALEIVNQDKIPIYQFFYKTPSHIVMNGIFPLPQGFLIANENGVVFNPKLPTKFKLNRIFKYPSWKYPGVYAK